MTLKEYILTKLQKNGLTLQLYYINEKGKLTKKSEARVKIGKSVVFVISGSQKETMIMTVEELAVLINAVEVLFTGSALSEYREVKNEKLWKNLYDIPQIDNKVEVFDLKQLKVSHNTTEKFICPRCTKAFEMGLMEVDHQRRHYEGKKQVRSNMKFAPVIKMLRAVGLTKAPPKNLEKRTTKGEKILSMLQKKHSEIIKGDTEIEKSKKMRYTLNLRGEVIFSILLHTLGGGASAIWLRRR